MTMVFALSALLVLVALVAWRASRLEHSRVLGHLNAVAPDGEVESYTSSFHARVSGNLRWLARASALLAGLLPLVGWRLLRASPRGSAKGAIARFGAELAEARSRYAKRTSSAHKRHVLLLVLAGALLRGWMLFAPITYDEAFTYTYYASRPLHVIVSDYSYPNNHVLHTLLVKVSTSLLGLGKVSLRLPAFLAGVLAMPLFYFFVRAMFNRYIALMALALVAGSGGLIEYGALGRGYSVTWLCMVGALLLGRHFLKGNNAFTAVLIGLVLALGMWSVPTMVYPALMVYLWLFLSVLFGDREEQAGRMPLWVLSLLVFGLASALLYLPVLLVAGLPQLLHHDSLPKSTWATFASTQHESALGLWVYLSETTSTWAAFAGLAGLAFAAYISAKYRMLLAAMALGSVPLVIAQAEVAPPRAWLYILFILHLSTAIALFYLLKSLSERFFNDLGKRTRTAVCAALLLVGTAWPGMVGIQDRVHRFPDAETCALYLKHAMEPGDRVLLAFPWEAPVEFHALAMGMDRGLLHGAPEPGAMVFIVTCPRDGQSPETLLRRHGMEVDRLEDLVMVKDWERLEIFAARLRTGHPADAKTREAP